MKKYIEIIIQENQYGNREETIRNLTAGIELTLILDTGRLTRKEQEILEKVGQAKMMQLYCEAIKTIAKEME